MHARALDLEMADHAALLRQGDSVGVGELEVEAHRRPAGSARPRRGASGGAIVPSGESSVMPQLVCTRAPRRCSIRRISASGQFEPPISTRFSVGQLAARPRRGDRARPARRVWTPTATLTPSSRIRAARLAPSVWRPGRTSLAPTAGAAKGSPQPLAWNIGTATSRTSLPVSAMASACKRAQRVQVVGAVRVEHALRRAGGARGVAEPRRRLLVEAAPLGRGAVRFEQRLVVPHLRAVTGQHDRRRGASPSIRMTCSRFGHSGASSRRSGARLDGHGERAVLGFVDHGREMGGGETRIERVADEPAPMSA